MTRFAKPDTVACPHCDWYFARRVLLSYSSYACKTYSDGGTINSLEDTIPNVGRCPSCNHVVANINQLTAIPNSKTTNWLTELWIRFTGKSKDQEYEYLGKPTFIDYADLFTNETKLSAKRTWALLACRAFHRQYCLCCERVTVGTKSSHRDKAHASPSQADKVIYREISDFFLDNPPSLVPDEYYLICADIYRLRQDFSSAIMEYSKVTNTDLDAIVKQGHKWCVEQNANLMEVR